MNLQEIIKILEQKISDYPGRITDFQRIRTKRLGKRVRKKFFNPTKDKNEYVFHFGGLNELQYNIGLEPINGKKHLRYGIVLSYETGAWKLNPLEHMEPQRIKLNEMILNNPEIFEGFQMWHYKGKKPIRSANYPVQPIHNPELHDFYMIGGLIKEFPENVNDPIFHSIVKAFDQLLPVYEYVFLDADLNAKHEKRLARICWNTNNWEKPSGIQGKSTYKDAHEYIKGYGLEEWFFDFQRLINGWHYAYLRPVQQSWSAYQGKIFDVTLYTKPTKGKYRLIANISNLQVITPYESDNAIKYYKSKNWNTDMLSELYAVVPKEKAGDDAEWGFNCKFKLQDVQFFEDNLVLSDQAKDYIPIGRYMLFNLERELPFPLQRNKAFKANSPDWQASEQSSIKEIKRSIKESELVRQDIHSAIQYELHLYLDEKHPGCTQREAQLLNGLRIDLKFRNVDQRFSLFEIKTHSDLRTSVRHAIGQLLEYAYYEGFHNIADLIIVSHHFCDAETQKYILCLSENLGLNIGYIQFDWGKKEIIQRLNFNI